MKSWIAPPLAVFGLFCLAGCGADGPAPNLFCPSPAVLQQASEVTVFLPGRQDVAAEVSNARITGIAGNCALTGSGHLLRVTLRAGFTATDGPANHAASITLPYFVAISEGDTVISKVLYDITLDFNGGATAAGAINKPVTVELPNVARSSGIDVLVGFQMTPAQLDYAASHPGGS